MTERGQTKVHSRDYAKTNALNPEERKEIIKEYLEASTKPWHILKRQQLNWKHVNNNKTTALILKPGASQGTSSGAENKNQRWGKPKINRKTVSTLDGADLICSKHMKNFPNLIKRERSSGGDKLFQDTQP
ncbi:hypothetical protein Aduo_003138 [Ancylostoma duodenale]